MKKEELQRLRFRNQYLITPNSVKCPFLYKNYKISDTHQLYAHIDLKVTVADLDGAKICLLGDLFDYQNPEKLNSDILLDLLNIDFQEILIKIGAYSGSFILIYHRGNDLKLIHDATATRKIFYCNRDHEVWFSSQPQLLANILDLNKTTNPELLNYYKSPQFTQQNNANIGNTTIYDDIRQLMPNHFYDVSSISTIRYWPNRKTEYIAMKVVMENCAKMVKGFMESITNRYEVMLPVTAGKDSRTLLAATKNFSERIYYYINKERHMDDRHPDIAIPKKLLHHLNLKFHVLDPYINIDDDFKRIYYENNEFASKEYLPIIYNYYYNFRDKVNLPGNTASAGEEWFMGAKMPISGKNLAKKNRVNRWNYAIEYYEQWIREIKEHCPENNICMLNLFYWEERCANWGIKIQLDKDIAQEDINPFNSRDLIMQYYSVQPKYLEFPYFRLHLEVINHLWPEVLKISINKSWRTTFLKVLKFFGILKVYFRIKYT